METRREFLKRSTVMLLLVPIAGACGSSSTPNTNAGGCDGVQSTSSVAQAHTHTVCVAAADLTNPPAAGMTFTTSFNSGHTHTLALSQEQLKSIASGQTVNAESSSNSGHTHSFAITMAAQGTTTPPPSGGGLY